MELPELSLAPSWSRLTPECSSSESSDTSSTRKRKAISDSFLETKSPQAASTHRNIIDLQHSSERLPLDWEQCLDLKVKSGKMYFLNRKTLKKSWDRPTTKDQYQYQYQYNHHHYINQKLDLELNISSPVSSKLTAQSLDVFRKDDRSRSWSIPTPTCATNYKDQMKKSDHNMVAMACMNCHMLVIVSMSSPICPNCKFVHSIPHQTSPAPPALKKPTSATLKPLDTLTLFS